MKVEDRDKLNECLKILDSTELRLSMVWLWTWSTICQILEDDSFTTAVTQDEMWDHLCAAVESGTYFSLDHGADQHQDEIIEWMSNGGFISDRTYD
jgi:hypothetical protein